MSVQDSKLAELANYLENAIARLNEIRQTFDGNAVNKEKITDETVNSKLAASFEGMFIGETEVTEFDAKCLAERAVTILSQELEDAAKYRNLCR